ncbi:MAG TPA: hypothetical protein PKC49_01295 [Phycisphaerae bacterium]|nr:hypothetical protein [Phycisphaerae bacterium]
MADQSYADDLTIADDAALWRLIHPTWAVVDENRGGLRVSSAAFENSPDGSPTSILIAEAVFTTRRGPEDVVHEGYGLASLTAGQARQCGQAVARDPLPNEPAHGLLVGPKTKSIRKRLAAAAAWVISLPNN